MDTVYDRFTTYVQVRAVTLIQQDREETGAGNCPEPQMPIGPRSTLALRPRAFDAPCNRA